MTIKMVKVEEGKYNVLANGSFIGECISGLGDMYVIDMPDGSRIKATTQSALKRMVGKRL